MYDSSSRAQVAQHGFCEVSRHHNTRFAAAAAQHWRDPPEGDLVESETAVTDMVSVASSAGPGPPRPRRGRAPPTSEAQPKSRARSASLNRVRFAREVPSPQPSAAPAPSQPAPSTPAALVSSLRPDSLSDLVSRVRAVKLSDAVAAPQPPPASSRSAQRTPLPVPSHKRASAHPSAAVVFSGGSVSADSDSSSVASGASNDSDSASVIMAAQVIVVFDSTGGVVPPRKEWAVMHASSLAFWYAYDCTAQVFKWRSPGKLSTVPDASPWKRAVKMARLMLASHEADLRLVRTMLSRGSSRAQAPLPRSANQHRQHTPSAPPATSDPSVATHSDSDHSQHSGDTHTTVSGWERSSAGRRDSSAELLGDTLGHIDATSGPTIRRTVKTGRMVQLGSSANSRFFMRTSATVDMGHLLAAYHSNVSDVRAFGDEDLLKAWIKGVSFERFENPQSLRDSFISGRFSSIIQFVLARRPNPAVVDLHDLSLAFDKMQSLCTTLYGGHHHFNEFLASAVVTLERSFTSDCLRYSSQEYGYIPPVAMSIALGAFVRRFDDSVRAWQEVTEGLLEDEFNKRPPVLSNDGRQLVLARVFPLVIRGPSFIDVFQRHAPVPIMPAVYAVRPPQPLQWQQAPAFATSGPAATSRPSHVSMQVMQAPAKPRPQSAVPSGERVLDPTAAVSASGAFPLWVREAHAAASAGTPWKDLRRRFPLLLQLHQTSASGPPRVVCAKFLMYASSASDGCSGCAKYLHLSLDGKPAAPAPGYAQA